MKGEREFEGLVGTWNEELYFLLATTSGQSEVVRTLVENVDSSPENRALSWGRGKRARFLRPSACFTARTCRL